MFKRMADSALDEWSVRDGRKPLVVRGARQVGKTCLVRSLASRRKLGLVELNFELRPELAALFAAAEVREILRLIEIETGLAVVPGESLLFLDEIQAAPELLPKLRYFYEQIPDLHVVAAGSLVEFSLRDHAFSMPVGRIEYLHLGPLNFEEFVRAADPAGEKLIERMVALKPGGGLPPSVHQKLEKLYLEYLLVGGLPESVGARAKQAGWTDVARLQDSLIATYQDDFAKYRGRVDYLRLRKVFHAIPRLLGEKLKYTRIDPEEQSRELARCLELLELAQVVYLVRHSAGRGVPLKAEVKERDFKPLFLDVGLAARMLGLAATRLLVARETLPSSLGCLAEQFIGQQLLHGRALHQAPELHYWRRQARSANAEVDYLIEVDDRVVPVEVKSGKTGTLRSLHRFIEERGSRVALRFNRDSPSVCPIDVAGKSCLLLSLPFYLVGQASRLVRLVE
jgi:predicted AAA+ superfamily ATPase